MSLFHRNFNREGPGVSKDEPRKKGFPRFIEILSRDFGSLFRSNLACTLAIIPGALIVTLGLLAGNVLTVLLGGIIGSLIFAPFWAGMHDTTLRSLRDEPIYWWNSYKKAMKNNWKQSLVPGLLNGLLVTGQILSIYLIIKSGAELNLLVTVLLILNLLVTGMCAPFLWAQLVLMDLPFPALLKNSLFLGIGNAPKGILLAVLQTLFWGAIILLLPFSSMLVIVFGFGFIVLICQMIAYPVLDKQFDLETQFNARREAELAEESEEFEEE